MNLEDVRPFVASSSSYLGTEYFSAAGVVVVILIWMSYCLLLLEELINSVVCGRFVNCSIFYVLFYIFLVS